MQLLALVQDVMVGMQLQRPSYVINNPDPSVMQMLTALSASADELVGRYPFTRTMSDGCWIESEAGEPQTSPHADKDEVLFDGPTIRMSMRWRYQEMNGFDYAEAFRSAEEQISRLAVAFTRASRPKVSH